MKVELQNGDEKPKQYILIAPETPAEDDFLLRLRSWWRYQDR